MVGAVGTEPSQTHWLPISRLSNIDRKDILNKMGRPWMIGRMHRQRLGIVIDGDVDLAAQGHPDACTGPTSSSKIVYQKFHNYFIFRCSAY